MYSQSIHWFLVSEKRSKETYYLKKNTSLVQDTFKACLLTIFEKGTNIFTHFSKLHTTHNQQQKKKLIRNTYFLLFFVFKIHDSYDWHLIKRNL